jgi:hypothetical protein
MRFEFVTYLKIMRYLYLRALGSDRKGLQIKGPYTLLLPGMFAVSSTCFNLLKHQTDIYFSCFFRLPADIKGQSLLDHVFTPRHVCYKIDHKKIYTPNAYLDLAIKPCNSGAMKFKMRSYLSKYSMWGTVEHGGKEAGQNGTP